MDTRRKMKEEELDLEAEHTIQKLFGEDLRQKKVAELYEAMAIRTDKHIGVEPGPFIRSGKKGKKMSYTQRLLFRTKTTS